MYSYGPYIAASRNEVMFVRKPNYCQFGGYPNLYFVIC